MDNIHILVVHSRGVYNLMGMILVAQVSLIFRFFQVQVQVYLSFKSLCM